MRITSMLSHNGNPVPNQFVISGNDGAESFRSYDTIIAEVKDGKTLLDPKWDCSKTTMKYAASFLGVDGKKDIQKRIDSGEYVVQNLNAAK